VTNQGDIRLTVQDTGYGIPYELQNKLFEQMVTTKDNGMGIGLYISRKLIMQLDGQLNLLSSSDEGTAFEIILPSSIRI